MATTTGRHLPHLLVRRRKALVKTGGLAALLAVIGPGVLAGLSDDDPAGIATYSVLGADYGYQMIWVLTISTAALIVFHLIAARMGVVTGKGLLTILHERYGRRATLTVTPALIAANFGTLCAEFAGVAAAMDLLAGVGKAVSVPLAALAIASLVLRGSFRYVEHVLLLLATVFVTYIAAGILAGPDWGAALQGAVVPRMPLTSDAMLIAVATVGTTLAPWGLVFIQSYAANKRIAVRDLRYENIDVIIGAVMTGVIGFFVVVACAATLHAAGVSIDTARDAAAALAPVAGESAALLFGIGMLGAALLGAAIVPLSSAYSVAEATGEPADVNDSFSQAREFYLAFIMMIAGASLVVLIPGAPLITILVLSQALNAVLLLPILPFLWHAAAQKEVMGEYAIGPAARIAAGSAMTLVLASVAALAYLTVFS